MEIAPFARTIRMSPNWMPYMLYTLFHEMVHAYFVVVHSNDETIVSRQAVA